MARWLLSTDVLVRHLGSGGQDPALTNKRLRDMAVSGLSFEWILVDIEARSTFSPNTRVKWRSNVIHFRELLLSGGGDVPGISLSALERWSRLQLLDLRHMDVARSQTVEMPLEERLVVATAIASGYIYVSEKRDWNRQIEKEFGLGIEEI